MQFESIPLLGEEVIVYVSGSVSMSFPTVAEKFKVLSSLTESA